MTAFHLGVNTCFAVKRWPRASDWADVVLDELGVDLVQHSLDLVDLCAPQSSWLAEAIHLQDTCSARGLELHSTFTGLSAYSSNMLLHPDPAARARAFAWYQRAIRFTARAGARACGGHVGAYSVPDWHDPLRRRTLNVELHKALGRLAVFARKEGLSYLMVENLASVREPSTMDSVAELLSPAASDRVQVALCLDIGHQCVPGTTGVDREPYEWLRRMATRAPVVQLQQSTEDADHHWPFTPETNRQGRIDGPRVLEAIRTSGASEVTLILEIIPAFEADDDQVLLDLKASIEYWRNALAGL